MLWKGPTAKSISFLVSLKILVFEEIIFKSDHESSTKALHEVIHACVRVEVIPQESLEGDLLANGRVEMAVKKGDTTLWNSPNFR